MRLCRYLIRESCRRRGEVGVESGGGDAMWGGSKLGARGLGRCMLV